MKDFIFQEELEQAALEAAGMVCSMVDASLADDTVPPKDILEWYAKTTVYQLAQAETMMIEQGLGAEKSAPREAVLALSSIVRQLLQLAAKTKMFWLTALIDDLLRVRQLRLPEHYQQMLQPDGLP